MYPRVRGGGMDLEKFAGAGHVWKMQLSSRIYLRFSLSRQNSERVTSGGYALGSVEACQGMCL